MESTKTSNLELRKLIGAAMLTAVAYALQLLEFPAPLSPTFAKMDLSDLPALIGSFAYGPWWGVIIEGVKNAIHLTRTATAGVGELANFLIGSALVLPAGLIYKHNKTRKSALIGCIVGSVSMGVIAAAANYFILLPMFESFAPIDQIIQMFADIMPIIRTKLDVVLLNALPLNMVKGFVISLITMLLYKRISPILKGA